jgi:hypothetical protein
MDKCSVHRHDDVALTATNYSHTCHYQHNHSPHSDHLLIRKVWKRQRSSGAVALFVPLQRYRYLLNCLGTLRTWLLGDEISVMDTPVSTVWCLRSHSLLILARGLLSLSPLKQLAAGAKPLTRKLSTLGLPPHSRVADQLTSTMQEVQKESRKRPRPTEPTTAPSPQAPDNSTLSLHPEVTPLSCVRSSAISAKALAVIEWTLFDGITQERAVDLYNKINKGNKKVKTKDAISWIFRKYGPMWYKEQEVVRPWKLYTNKEKAEMIKQGLGEDDFPFIHPRDRPRDTVEQSLDNAGSEEPSSKMCRVRTRSDEQTSLDARPPKPLPELVSNTNLVPANSPCDINGSEERFCDSHQAEQSSQYTPPGKQIASCLVSLYDPRRVQVMHWANYASF